MPFTPAACNLRLAEKERTMPKRKKGKQQVKVRVGAVQMISRLDRVQDNVEKALSYCERAAQQGVEIVLLARF